MLLIVDLLSTTLQYMTDRSTSAVQRSTPFLSCSSGGDLVLLYIFVSISVTIVTTFQLPQTSNTTTVLATYDHGLIIVHIIVAVNPRLRSHIIQQRQQDKQNYIMTMNYLKLNSGGDMPIVGYGTWQATDNSLEIALNKALKSGYRHIDTATLYENEHIIGKVLKEWISSGKVIRDELFIVTKLPAISNRPEDIEKTLKKSLEDLQLDYVDLYLVHNSFALLSFDVTNLDNVKIDHSTDHLKIWKVMEEQVTCGRTKAIGLSNFNMKQIQRILDNCTIKPANLQVEHHVYIQQHELMNFCKYNGIVVTAYSCLGTKGGREVMGMAWSKKDLPEMMENETILNIAEKYNKTVAQVMLRYIVQRDIAVIPKSTNPERLVENIQIFDFELDDEDMEALKSLDAGDEGRIFSFTFFPGITEHPEYPFPKPT